MTIMEPLYLYGCRHDILGHYLKAIGLLRTLSQCADEKLRDPEAEGWWDLERGCLLSPFGKVFDQGGTDSIFRPTLPAYTVFLALEHWRRVGLQEGSHLLY